jgi:hypothetical protein
MIKSGEAIIIGPTVCYCQHRRPSRLPFKWACDVDENVDGYQMELRSSHEQLRRLFVRQSAPGQAPGPSGH